MRRHGYALSPGTLDPVLHRLADAGYLAVAPRVVGGKLRKYRTITAAGRRVLEEARAKITELVEEVLEGRGPERLPDPLPSADGPTK